MESVAPILAPLTILWIIAVVVGLNRDSLGKGVAGSLGALAGINLVGYLVGYWGGAALRFPEGVRRALTIELGMQNAGLGVGAGTTTLPDDPRSDDPTGAVHGRQHADGDAARAGLGVAGSGAGGTGSP